jgi:dipeptidyl aminopeptidase/acylaminoacyl peptidase
MKHVMRWLAVLVCIKLAAVETSHAQTSPAVQNTNNSKRPAGVSAYEPYYRIFGHVQPTWSSDDTNIAFATVIPGGDQGALYTVPSRGGEIAPLLKDDYWSATPAWAPDARRIAFMSSRGTPSHIWTVDMRGGQVFQITTSEFGLQFAPSWSPDGKQIAYTSLPGPRIMIVPSTGGAGQPFAVGMSPQWSPDGKRIAYTAPEPLDTVSGDPTVGKWSIYIKNVDGGEPGRLACSTGQESGGTWILTASWSPDGRRLVSTSIMNGRSQLIIINVADDRIESTIPTSGSALFPAWSHDGKRIAYTSVDSGCPGEIHTIAPNGKRDMYVTRQRRYGTAKLIRYKSADGLQIPAYLYEPRVPAGKKHPALVWLHGGWPGTAAVLDLFDSSIQYFVDHGFIVLAPNYRGSIGFGERLAAARAGDWLDRIHDISAAVTFLRSRPSVDAERIGVLGHSVGAYLALLTAERHPREFAAVVDFYGPTDLTAIYKDVPTYRPLLKAAIGGTPEDCPEEYRIRSPITYVESIEAPVLILHGDADKDCPISQSLLMADALKRSGKQYEFVAIPKAEHYFAGRNAELAFETTMQFLTARIRPRGRVAAGWQH